MPACSDVPHARMRIALSSASCASVRPSSGRRTWPLTRRPSSVRARRIVRTRTEIRGFSSLEDLGTVRDLAPDVVEDTRELAIFLPRS